MKILLLSLFIGVYTFTGLNLQALELDRKPKIILTEQNPEKMILLVNPIKDGTLKLAFSNVQSENINVVIINSIGKQVYTAERSLNKQTQIFDVSSLASGIYFLRVNTDRSNFVKKLIIQ